ncbi:MAG: hypothetical protein DI626_01190 [Micavibrio aeruginosavorus]|uniref:Zeta toxin domain-containing protein n=1 Tax=Micavibrio aeruginosavorus TaxID=349221 RepID=A0A2W5A5Y1_9BACT|nr:MAG: hypothetical protein DI626_01190 [Micavibrio aeruginosavorus]
MSGNPATLTPLPPWRNCPMRKSSAISETFPVQPDGYATLIDRQRHEDFFTSEFPAQVAADIIERTLSGAQSHPNPSILHMLGIPGAGKSTYVAALDHTDKILVSFDKITEMIPAYQNDRKELGALEAFAKWELPARMLGYHILHMAVGNRQDIIFDHGGSRDDHAAFLGAIKRELGYRIEIVHLDVDQVTSMRRVHVREQDGGRHVPPAYIPERHDLIERLLPRYRDIADSFITVTL